jgi:KAP family P-loop domain
MVPTVSPAIIVRSVVGSSKSDGNEEAGDSASMPDTVFRSSQPQHGLDEKTDAFGHRDYAAVVVQTLLAAEAPFTLGLYGPWGVGKSTIIYEVGRQLASEDCAFVEFDAWRYDSDALRTRIRMSAPAS